ncbi:hypothetical protein HNQ07_001697 [Deinococcus metalli]|jgi:hypothetical protein|nr:hypothetical protein [Deinococcus metalli]MBB5376240.1 hypothetical protein [Deinococcus metalli]
MNGLLVFGAATLPTSLPDRARRPGWWEYHGEWLTADLHLRAEREVRLARRLSAQPLLDRLTR